MEEKKVIKVRLITAVLLILLFIMLIAYIVLVSIEKNNLNDKKNANMVYINTVGETGSSKPTEIKPKETSSNINVVASLEDEITTNSAWCGTFQLVWNDMVNNIVKQDVKFYAGDNLKIAQKIADNLDKQTFTEKELAEKDYYKVYDLKTLELKEKIETSIKEKFNETSDVLDDIDWSDAPKDNSGYDEKNEKIYIFYTILKKIFNFENNFDELENDKFACKFENIKYFGINEDSNSKLYSQVEVLYYNTNDDFAVILNTKEGEQVILARGLEGNTFASMYNDIVTKTNSYDGNKEFTENDYLKVPNIKLNVKRNFDELCNKFFLTKNEERGEIKKAIQTIQLDMDKSGGKIKSEAIIEGNFISSEAPAIKVEHRYFYLNDEFTMFLKEKDKELPYFAANIEDITLFQD